ncbi:MAG: pilus assembly protein PilM [Pirellulales bacterium]|nr:pilus assembly protein PilM [Pirellulales bacterium]
MSGSNGLRGANGAAAASAVLRCPECGHPRPQDGRFCTHCGAPLWEPCPRCEVPGPIGETYCGACGANLAEIQAEKIAKIEQTFTRAEEFRAQGYHERAILTLRSLTEDKNAQETPPYVRAKKLIRQIAEERERGSAQAAEALRLAKEAFNRRDYAEARRVVDETPEGLRDEELQQLGRRAANTIEEIASLEAELPGATNGRWSPTVPVKVERLLTLVPDHEEARRCAERLRDRLQATARHHLAKREYRAALRAWELIPASASTPEMDAQRQRLAELVWLVDDVRTAPVVDRVLPEVAEKLVKLAPRDTRFAGLVEQVRRRAQAASQAPDLTLPEWQARSEEHYLGCPVDWATGLRRLTVADASVAQRLRAQPGCFWVAAGLALQGLGQGPVAINLIPDRKTGILARVIGRAGKVAAPVAWGLDLSPSGLKAVRLAMDKETGGVAIADCEHLAHSKPLGQTADAAEQIQCLRTTVDAFLERHPLGNECVCVGFPGRNALFRVIALPPQKQAKAAGAVELQWQRHAPYPLDEMTWDFQPFDEDGTTSPAKQQFLITATKNILAQQRVALFEELGIRPRVLQSDSLALHNLFAFEGYLDDFKADPAVSDDDRRPALAVIDMGSNATNIVVSAPGLVWANSMALGADRFVKRLAAELHIPLAEARWLLHRPAEAPWLHILHETIEPLFEDLVREIQRSLALFAASNARHDVSRMVGAGGGFQTHGLLRHLRCGPIQMGHKRSTKTASTPAPFSPAEDSS